MNNKKKIYFAMTNCQMTPFLIPYSWGLLRAYAEQDAVVRENYEFVDPFHYGHMTSAADIIGKVDIDKPFVFAASCFIWNFNLHMKLCKIIKERFPSCTTIVGGPYIPYKYLSEGFFEKHPYIDLVAYGDGEIAFKNVLLELLNDRPVFNHIGNLAININGSPQYPDVEAEKLPRKLNLENFPSPYISGYFDELVPKLQKIATRSSRIMGMITGLLETQRGCGNKCIYCSWPNQEILHIEQARVFEELEYMARLGIQSLLLADSNFGLHERDIEVAKKIVEIHERTGKLSHVATTFSKRHDISLEIGRILSRLGNDSSIILKGINMPMQSTSEKVLAAINRQNYSLEEYQKAHRIFIREKIPTLTDMMLPLPEETRSSWMNGLCDLMHIAPETQVRTFLWILTPDSQAYVPDFRQKYGLKCIERDLFSRGLYKVPNDEHPQGLYVVETNTMTREDWVDCKAFFEIIVCVLQNGAYTKFIASYLNKQGLLDYRSFYVGLYEYYLKRPDTLFGSIIDKNRHMAREFIEKEQETELIQTLFQDDIKSFLIKYTNMDIFGNNSDWAWLKIAENRDIFYKEIVSFLEQAGVDVEKEELMDCIAFQSDIMLSIDYDPTDGKTREYAYNWPTYFGGEEQLCQEPIEIHFTDTIMGTLGKDRIQKGSLYNFSKAALGNLGYEGIVRRYHHQFDKIQITRKISVASVV